MSFSILQWPGKSFCRGSKNRARKAGNGRFQMSTDVFAGKSENLPEVTPHYYCSADNPPNQSQKEAVELSFRKSLSIVWGAPGTGKTATIACAAEAHLKAGRRVLFLSTSNSTVDSAVEAICAQTENGFYGDDRILRLGLCSSENLAHSYPNVGMNHFREEEESIAAKHASHLERQSQGQAIVSKPSLEALEAQIAQAEQKMEADARILASHYRELEAVRSKVERTEFRINELLHEQERLIKNKDSLNPLINSFKNELTNLNAEQSKLLEKYTAAHNLYTANAEALQAHKLSVENQPWADSDAEKGGADEEGQADDSESIAIRAVSLLATTFTKALAVKNLPAFDVLIVDEVNRASLPMLFWALSKCKLSATLFGDFNQFAPRSSSDEDSARKWIARNIFHHLNINSAHVADVDPRVVMLDTQYRMAAKIAAVTDELFYGGYLQNARHTARLALEDGLSGASPLVLADVAKLKSWAVNASDGNAFNLVNALISASIARALLEESPAINLGIVSPYPLQCDLISKVLDQWGLSIKVDTIQGYQDTQKDVIIFDTVDAPGSRSTFLDNKRLESYPLVSLNVAITSARKKLYLVAHKEYLEAVCKERMLRRTLAIFEHEGHRLNTQQFLPTFSVLDDNDANKDVPSFWPALCQDLRLAGQSVVIMSPFMSAAGIEKLKPSLADAIRRGLPVTIFTRPPTTYNADLAPQVETGIKALESLGCTVHLRRGMHQKLAVIDKSIAWEGSFHILSHATNQEQMRRIVGKSIVTEIVDSFGLSGAAARLNGAKHYCADCGSELVRRHAECGDILACPAFPACKYEEDHI